MRSESQTRQTIPSDATSVGSSEDLGRRDSSRPRRLRKSARTVLFAIALVTPTLGATGLAGCSSRPQNVVLITIDTLRPDRLGQGGNARATSPAMDALAANGATFTAAYSQAGWTLPSIATILTGLYPGEHGAVDMQDSIRPGIPTLASLLRARGFDTRAFVSHVMLGPDHGLTEGFGAYDDSVLEIGHPHLVSTASQLTDLALDALREIDEPFLIWVHYFDPHFRYLPKEPRFGTDRLALYDAEIAFTDEQIGRLLEGVRYSGVFADTLVVLTADHGEEFGEHGGILHYSLYEEDVQVPLILIGPGIEPGVRPVVAQQIDILPTVLARLGIDPPAGLPGRDLLEVGGEDRPIFIERMRPRGFVQRALIFGGKKLYSVGLRESFTGDLEETIQTTGLKPSTELYDLALDPGERNDLFDPEDPEAQRLVEMLAGYGAPESTEGEARPVDATLRKQLQSLGYLE